MPDFARKLMAAYRGNPEETEKFWDDLDREELMEPYDLREREDWRPPTENLTNGKSGALGYCGRHTLPTDPDQDDLDAEGEWW